VNSTEQYEKKPPQFDYFRQLDCQRSEKILSGIKECFEPAFLSNLDKVMLAYSGFVAGIALVSLTPHASTNLQVVLGSLAFWTGAVCYLYKCRKTASARQN
jgi:hypothetical protein